MGKRDKKYVGKLEISKQIILFYFKAKSPKIMSLNKIIKGRKLPSTFNPIVTHNTCPSTRNIMTDASSTAEAACFSIIEGILATAASLKAIGIPSIPMVVVMAKSSITSDCDFEILRTPPVSTTINSCTPQKDLPYKRSLVTPGSSTTIALFPYINQKESQYSLHENIRGISNFNSQSMGKNQY
jgi:hypothetical protein